MKQTIEVQFPGGKKVDAKMGNMVIKTDQSQERGGEGSAPEPFTLFLASIATCAGVYALGFCHSRTISAEGMALTMDYEFDEGKKMVTTVQLHLKLPEGFPEKYKTSIIKAMDLCTVKRHLMNPPEFEIRAS